MPLAFQNQERNEGLTNIFDTWLMCQYFKKPKIIFVLTDDQEYSDVSWHNRLVKSPNLDVLREKGLTIGVAIFC